MKTNLDANLYTELCKETATVIIGVELRFSPTYLRYTNCDVPYYFNGERYAPRGVEFESIEQGSNLSVDQCTVLIPNVDSNVSDALLAANRLGNGVFLYIAALNASGAAIATDLLWRGLLDDYNISQQYATLELVNELIHWQKQTLRKTTASCPWVFKGTECTYSGVETSCDKTYERCEVLANTDNFGGFRWLPSVTEKDVRWGGNG